MLLGTAQEVCDVRSTCSYINNKLHPEIGKTATIIGTIRESWIWAALLVLEVRSLFLVVNMWRQFCHQDDIYYALCFVVGNSGWLHQKI